MTENADYLPVDNDGRNPTEALLTAPAVPKPDYWGDIAKIIAVGLFAAIGLLGLWGIEALVGLCERHRWWAAAFALAALGLGWALAFVCVLVAFLWKSTRRPQP